MTEAVPGTVSISVPERIPAGLVAVTRPQLGFGSPRGQAVLVRVDGDHSADAVLDVLRGIGSPIPPWPHVEGGVSTTRPGTSHTAIVALPAGRYYVVDPDAARLRP